MKKLKLPIAADFPEQRKWLSMDEYVGFVNFSLKIRVKTNRKRDEIKMRVNTPFCLQ